MQRSQDLLDAYERVWTELTKGAQFAQFLAASPDVTLFGTDANEWWGDRETVLREGGPQLEAFSQLGAQYLPNHAVAWTEQDVGWVADQPTLRLMDGRAVQLRVTTILRHEDGEWKIVHIHSSIGIPNDSVEVFQGV